MDVNADQNSQLIVKMFFDLNKKDIDDKVFCRCCEQYFKDNKGIRHLTINNNLNWVYCFICFMALKSSEPCKNEAQ